MYDSVTGFDSTTRTLNMAGQCGFCGVAPHIARSADCFRKDWERKVDMQLVVLYFVHVKKRREKKENS
jgi:energy-converting hydrogenase Eha subunit H